MANFLEKALSYWTDEASPMAVDHEGQGDDSFKLNVNPKKALEEDEFTNVTEAKAVSYWTDEAPSMAVDHEGQGDDFSSMNWNRKKLEKENELKKVAEPESRTPQIKGIPTNLYVLNTSQPIFLGHHRLASFGIGVDGELVLDNHLPTLVCDPATLLELLRGKDLTVNHKANVLIKNYVSYRELKWNYFIQVLDSLELDRKPPTFVCFAGVIVTLLTTPYGHENWVISGYRKNGTIYLRKVRQEERPKPETYLGPRKKPAFEHRNQPREKPEVGFETYLLKFVQLATDLAASERPVIESDKKFGIFETTFNGNSLVLLNEVDAVHNGDLIKLAIRNAFYKPFHAQKFYKRKVQDTWAQVVSCGLKTTVICERNFEGRVYDVQVHEDLVALAEDNGYCFEPLKCYDFLKRFMDFAKSLLVEDNPKKVVRFFFKKVGTRQYVNARYVTEREE